MYTLAQKATFMMYNCVAIDKSAEKRG